MKTREELIDEMAKAIYATGVALDGTDYAFGVYDDDDHFHRMANALYAANIGDVTEWKHRAEVAERALRRKCESEADNDCPYDENSEKCKECAENRLCSTKYATQCYYEKAIQQAEREIEEEKEK